MKVPANSIFPFKLYDMLEEAKSRNFEHIVSWLPNCSSFKVHNVIDFVQEILPHYFGSQIRYRSFQRQLNLYSFQRCTDCGEGRGMYDKAMRRRAIFEVSMISSIFIPSSFSSMKTGAYSHSMFKKGSRHLCKLIVRKNTGNSKPKALPSAPQFQGNCDIQVKTIQTLPCHALSGSIANVSPVPSQDNIAFHQMSKIGTFIASSRPSPNLLSEHTQSNTDGGLPALVSFEVDSVNGNDRNILDDISLKMLPAFETYNSQKSARQVSAGSVGLASSLQPPCKSPSMLDDIDDEIIRTFRNQKAL